VKTGRSIDLSKQPSTLNSFYDERFFRINPEPLLSEFLHYLDQPLPIYVCADRCKLEDQPRCVSVLSSRSGSTPLIVVCVDRCNLWINPFHLDCVDCLSLWINPFHP